MIAALFTVQLAMAAPDRPLRRVAIVAGANDGGPDRTRLRYATHDARSVAEVLVELGGVATTDVVLLTDPGVDAFRDALAEVGRLATEDQEHRVQAIVYYSGHSDEAGLLLGSDRYAYVDLRSDLDALQVEVRIAVLDSCASGALVVGKGGAPVPAFLVDTSSSVEGHAFLTSSSADEVSQEAARIGGSFFTHALVSGLRGAADADRDQRVTLQEAYDFAHAETLSRTESTMRGTQHPQYEFDLTGSGDLVLTDLSVSSSGVRLPEPVEGRIHIWSADGSLAAELHKTAGRPREIGLPPGRYRVVIDGEDTASEARLSLEHGQLALLDPAELRPLRRIPTVARGGRLRDRPAVLQHWPTPADQDRRDHLAIGLVTGSASLDGAAFGLGATLYEGDVTGVQLAGIANQARGRMRGWQGGMVFNGAGGLAGVQTGLVNSADDSDGLQIGAINRAGSLDGLSVGLINVADTGEGMPLGLINVVRDGILDVKVWSSDLSLVNIGLESGTRRFFTGVMIGYDPGDTVGLSSAGGSLGVRPVWRGPFTWDVDAAAMAHFPRFLSGEQVVVVPTLRTSIGWDFVERFGVFAGVSLGGHVSLQAPDAKVTSMPDISLPLDETRALRLHPGWFAGIRF